MDIKQYIKGKIKFLKKEFHMTLTEEEIDHFYSLKTENDVDRYVRDLFSEKL